jgi:hypothetical protein
VIVYIAGPMTGLPDLNYPAFNAAEEALTAAGHAVLNPARNGTIVGSNAWQQYMRLSIAQVLQAEAVALLPGWVNSRGALLERRIAKALDLQIGPVERFLGGEPS